MKPALRTRLKIGVIIWFSLTPDFSWVFGERVGTFNRFEGFARGKPLKRLERDERLADTQLKQGVNEMLPNKGASIYT